MARIRGSSAMQPSTRRACCRARRATGCVNCFRSSPAIKRWHDDSFPGIAKGLLLARGNTQVSPLILRALGVNSAQELCYDGGPLSFLHDRGDRAIVAHVLANIPAILTTDRRTFWVHRDKIRDMGVEILRPSELLDLYIPYWDAMEYEFARRRAESRR